MLRLADPGDPSSAARSPAPERGRSAGAQAAAPVPSVSDFERFIFIVGAPRCGTTSLAEFVKGNASVSSAIVKEPHYFAQNDLRPLSDAELRARVEGEYLRRFFRSDRARRIGLDASVTYLYAPEQLAPVVRLWPESRFIVSLRDPVTMLPSLHRRLLYIGDEAIRSFDKAWAAIPDRRRGRRIPSRCADPRWLFYDEAARYSTYLERLFAAVGQERCLVLIFDDLAASPIDEYRRLMDFAGLESDPRIDLTPRRVSSGVRSHWLQRILKRPPLALRELLAGEKFHERLRDLDTGRERRVSRSVLSFRKRVLEWNRAPAGPDRLSPYLQDEICRAFKGEVERLGDLIGRIPAQWLQPANRDVRVKKRRLEKGGNRAAFASEMR